jgi:SAM-dependent methyltransferase
MENVEKTELSERSIGSKLVAKSEIKYEFKTLDGNLVQCKELNELPWSSSAHQFIIQKHDITKDFPIWFSHSTLVALLHYIDFKTVLDIGCGEGLVSKIFKFLGKQVTTIEPGDSDPRLSEFEPIEIDFKKDYLTLNFDKKFDVIWTSHVLEHIRNPGIFLDKIFNDLNEGGTLALTVPYFELNDPEFIVDSHINKFSIGTMIYHLITAGFDCKNISITVDSWEICVLLKKVSNGLQQTSSAKGLAEIKNFLPNLNVQHTFRSDGSLLSFKFEKDPINWPNTEKQYVR